MHTAFRVILCSALCAPGCSGADDGLRSPDGDTDLTSHETHRFVGDVPNAGLGHAIALRDDAAWASAPHAEPALVVRLSTDGQTETLLEVPRHAGLALGVQPDGLLLVGAPLLGTGQIFSIDGAVLFEGQGVGRAIAEGPVAMTASGWRDAAGQDVSTEQIPTSLTASGGTVAAGFAHGLYSGIVGDQLIEREYASEGFAIASGDLDGNGSTEWLLGSPQANVVRVVDATGATIREIRGPEGRFGAAIAAADCDGDGRAEVLIGAPNASSGAGVAVLYDGDGTELFRIDGESDDRLGTSVAINHYGLLAGAPGAQSSPGAVVWRHR